MVGGSGRPFETSVSHRGPCLEARTTALRTGQAQPSGSGSAAHFGLESMANLLQNGHAQVQIRLGGGAMRSVGRLKRHQFQAGSCGRGPCARRRLQRSPASAPLKARRRTGRRSIGRAVAAEVAAAQPRPAARRAHIHDRGHEQRHLHGLFVVWCGVRTDVQRRGPTRGIRGRAATPGRQRRW